MKRRADGESPTGHYLDVLEREAQRCRPLRGLHWGHLLIGGGIGAFLTWWFCLPGIVHGQLSPAWPLVGAAIGSVFWGCIGRWSWNRLLKKNLAELRALAQSNLIEHDLLLVCIEDDLPARFESLRHVSQSRGKTRTRNYSELRRGSMQDRIRWLVENYNAICSTLKLRSSTQQLERLGRGLMWLMLLPLFFLLLAMVLLAVRLIGLQYIAPVMMDSMGAVLTACALALGPLVQINTLQSAALASELVAALRPSEPASDMHELSQEELEAGGKHSETDSATVKYSS